MSGVETPVSGGGADAGAPDGVSGAPDGGNTGGRTTGGESGGGGYANPHAGKAPSGGFMGHGGQTDIAYHGGGQAGEQGGDAPNAVTGSDSSDGEERGAGAWAAPVYAPHPVEAGGSTIEVTETNGIAQAEQLGKVATDSAYEAEQESPGAG